MLSKFFKIGPRVPHQLLWVISKPAVHCSCFCLADIFSVSVGNKINIKYFFFVCVFTGYRRASAADLHLSPLEFRIEELRHHFKIELAVVEGFKNVTKMLNESRSSDRKSLAEVSFI